MPRPLLTGIPGRIAAASRWRRVGPAVAAIALVATVLGAIVGAGLPGSSRGASTSGKSSGGTATVERRDLIATDTVAGTLSYANPATVFNRISGTITALPAVGSVIKPGQRLYSVSGNPVILFNGSVPAYRDLSAGVADGADVEQLKQNLVNLGFDPNHQITVNQTFDSATTSALDAWQASLGETQTGTVTLGQVVFLPGPQRITAVDSVLGSTGGSGGGSSGAGSGSSSGSGAGSGSTTTGASTTIAPQARTEFASYVTTIPSQPAKSPNSATTSSCPTTATGTTTTTTPTATTPTTMCPTTTPTSSSGKQKTSGPTAQQLLAELVAQLKKLAGASAGSGRSGSVGAGSAGGATGAGSASGAGSAGRSAGGATRSPGTTSAGGAASGGSSGGGASAGSSGSSGGGSGTAQAILQTTSTQLVVSVQLDATKQSEAVVGEPVTVQLPDGSTVDGRIRQVSPVAQSSSSSSGSSSTGSGGSSSTPTATIPVTIAINGHQAGGLDQAAVSVNFEQQVQRNVLSVPVTALLATAGGHYAVQEANAPHSLLPVTPGLFAAGYVQVDGAQIYSGLQVTDSQG